MPNESGEKINLHPRIAELAHHEFYHKAVDQNSGRKAIANARYSEGYISARAQLYYVYRVSQLNKEIDEATQELCAEIGFWWAMYEYTHVARGKLPFDIPTLPSKMS